MQSLFDYYESAQKVYIDILNEETKVYNIFAKASPLSTFFVDIPTLNNVINSAYMKISTYFYNGGQANAILKIYFEKSSY